MFEIEKKVFKVNRRNFLKVGMAGAGGLLLGIPLACKPNRITGNDNVMFAPNVYLQIKGDGEIIIFAHRAEMGTGVKTSFALIIADELEADWKKIQIIQADGDKKYGDQNTDGSNSIQWHYFNLRKVGATAKHMLTQAAAQQWGVNMNECRAENHTIVHQSGKTLGYGYLAEKASLLDLPADEEVKTKSKQDFKYISKKSSIYDLSNIVEGKSEFGIDVQIPDLAVAVMLRNPEPGAGIKSYDAEAAKNVPGVIDIFTLDNTNSPFGFEQPLGGIAIVAKNTWTALKARSLLKVNWEQGKHKAYNTDNYLKRLSKKAKQKGIVRRKTGNVYKAFNSSTKIIECLFETPHYSHAPMEPPCATALVKEADTCEIWAPVQSPQWVQAAVARALNLSKEQITVHVSLLGGAFGRKSKPDFVVEAALISAKSGKPVKLIWTREDDIQHDFYHANSIQYIKAGIDKNNKVNAWLHRSLAPAIGWGPDPMVQSNGELSLGMLDIPYDFENLSCETNEAQKHIRVGWLRSVSNIHHAFAISSMLDIIAEARNIDPMENAIELIGADREIDFHQKMDDYQHYRSSIEQYPRSTKRLKNTIRKIRELSGWNQSIKSNKSVGFAVHSSFLSYVACVVEVEVDEQNNIIIPNIYYVVDCGVAVNPDRIKAQFEGGAVFGLSLALKSEITVSQGRVNQSNFDDYQVIRIADAPLKTHVHIIESDEWPTGVGEPPVPPVIPALCNAIYKATGERIYQLPFKP